MARVLRNTLGFRCCFLVPGAWFLNGAEKSCQMDADLRRQGHSAASAAPVGSRSLTGLWASRLRLDLSLCYLSLMATECRVALTDPADPA